jgi:hypothetical protein
MPNSPGGAKAWIVSGSSDHVDFTRSAQAVNSSRRPQPRLICHPDGSASVSRPGTCATIARVLGPNHDHEPAPHRGAPESQPLRVDLAERADKGERRAPVVELRPRVDQLPRRSAAVPEVAVVEGEGGEAAACEDACKRGHRERARAREAGPHHHDGGTLDSGREEKPAGARILPAREAQVDAARAVLEHDVAARRRCRDALRGGTGRDEVEGEKHSREPRGDAGASAVHAQRLARTLRGPRDPTS